MDQAHQDHREGEVRNGGRAISSVIPFGFDLLHYGEHILIARASESAFTQLYLFYERLLLDLGKMRFLTISQIKTNYG